jgi:hypothetical protein
MNDRTLRSNGQALLHTRETRDLILDLAVDILRVSFGFFKLFQANFCIVRYFTTSTFFIRRLQYSSRLTLYNPITVAARSGIPIPLETWMSMCVYSVCAVLCVDSGLATG